jgi:hypothetical protein
MALDESFSSFFNSLFTAYMQHRIPHYARRQKLSLSANCNERGPPI